MVRKAAFLALLVSPAIAAANPYTSVNYPNANLTMREQVNPPAFFLREPASPVQRAARAFGACVRHAFASLPAGIAPEAASASLMQSCDASFQAVGAAANEAISASRLSETRKANARAELRTRLELVPQRLAASVRASRPLGMDVFAR